jgi:uncharacterized protein (DUF1810 family)
MDDGGMAGQDPFDLRRFVEAQEPVIERVRAELRRGRKTSHWMWFIFPQMRGLGHSAMAEKFGIGSREEAEEYWKHPVLGARLEECTRLVNQVEGRTAAEIFGYPDDLKFRSSMSLFALVSESAVFREALKKYFGGQPDDFTANLG